MSNRADVKDAVDVEAALNRKKVIDALRSGKHKQQIMAAGAWWTKDAPVCWWGLTLRVLGDEVRGPWKDYYIVRSKLGMTGEQCQYMIRLNDMHGYSFPALADIMEALPPPIKNT